MRDLRDELAGEYDVICFIASLHHIMDEDQRLSVLEQARQILAPDGLLCMTNWYLHSPHNAARYASCITHEYSDESKDYTIKI